ncbi:MAG: DsbC family protein [Pseudomonadota bacterium]|nr:DsbC family protein [Pseudomonadota bacterium]
MSKIRWFAQRLVVGLILSGSMPLAFAEGEATAVDTIRERIGGANPRLTVANVAATEVEGLYRVQTAQGPVLYATADGGHFVVGELYAVTEAGFVNLSQRAMNSSRTERLQAVPEEDLVVFSSPDAQTRVYVFTDVDCPFCSKMHEQMASIHKQGIEVAYVAFPRNGPGSPTYRKMVSIWCAEDRKAAMTASKAGRAVKSTECANPVAQQFRLGLELGVQATPSVVLEDGRLISGFVSAEHLRDMIAQGEGG